MIKSVSRLLLVSALFASQARSHTGTEKHKEDLHEPESSLTVGQQGSACTDPSFARIQDAIDAAAPGSVIRVCKGVYDEQLSINKSLDIDADPGVFVVPAFFKQNATGLASGVPIAAGILVSGTDSVSITGLTVDGINNAITQCSPRPEGIYYQNASGKIDHVVVRNMRLGPGLGGCQSGTGILVESGSSGSSNVEIVDCKIYDFQKNGITANEVGTRVFVRGNTVTGIGPTTGAAQNGIQIGFGATGKVIRNTVVNMIWSPCTDANTCQAVATNILIAESDGVEVRDNTVSISQVGIFADGNSETISKNSISNSFVFDGIRVEGNDSKILNNRVTTAGEALVFVQGDENNVIHNTLSDAPVGVLKVTGSIGNKFEANVLDNVVVQIVDPASPAPKVIPER